MILEVIATWTVIGFFSAVGWNVADKTVNKNYVDPLIEKIQKTDAPAETATVPTAKNK